MTICYLDSVGRIQKEPYRLGKRYEGTMVLFPGDFNHIVYPYHTSNEYRISIAGDIAIDSMQSFELIPTHTSNDLKYRNFPPM